MKKILPFSLYVFVFIVCSSFANIAYSQCPGCVIDMNFTVSPAEPAISPDTLPDGFTNQYYDADIDIYLPAQFQHSTGMNVTLNELEVLSVTGLPFGMHFESSSATNIFYPSQNPPQTEHACAKICGTPVFPGQYYVTVFVRAYVSTPVGSQVSDDSFNIPLYIHPGGSGTASFTVSNTMGCGSVTADFQTNMPSNGHPGFSYSWDFGNGATSQSETPPTVVYDTPGTYYASCETIIDTMNFHYLNEVTVIGTSCSDLFSKPDLYIIVKDLGGTIMHQSAVVDNQDPPVTFSIPNIQFNHFQNYEIEVWNEKGFLTPDEHCHTFMISGANTGDTLWAGQNGITFTTESPVFKFNDTVSITVYPLPDKPTVTASPSTSVCAGDSILLLSDTAPNYQWHNDTSVILGANNMAHYVHSSGFYFLVVADSMGCQVVSDTLEIIFHGNPPKPNFWRQGDSLFTLSTAQLQWYFDSVPVPGATSQSFHISDTGFYLLRATSSFGCVTYSDEIYYQPFNLSAGSLEASNFDFLLYPNPTEGSAELLFETATTDHYKVNITNMIGQSVFKKKLYNFSGSYRESLHLSGPVVYIVTITSSNSIIVRERLVVL